MNRNLFPHYHAPYFVCTPPYTDKSSGVRTLHLLCHMLNTLGERARLVILPTVENPETVTNPMWNTPTVNPEEEKYYKFKIPQPIFIYPDIIRDNPYQARNVVRYLLAPAGAYGGSAQFPETDDVWGAHRALADRVMTLPVSDPRIFYPAPSHLPPLREGGCFYAHKYDRIHGNALLPITRGATRLEGSLDDIAFILRASKRCYLYENAAIITEAPLCGCPVTLIRTPYFEGFDLERHWPLGQVKWDDGEVVSDMSERRTQWEYQIGMERAWDQAAAFVKHTKERFL